MPSASQSNLSDQNSSTFTKASKSRRFLNYVIDSLLAMIICPLNLLSDNSGFSDDSVFFILAIWWVIYYVIIETWLQRTPAKFLTGTKVIKIDGSKPEAMTILKRTLSRLVPFEPLSGNDGTWWHDRWSKTLVVKK